ncbi:Protein LEG1 like [Pseudolycoriella hygida]|uniref:Protein LEG1 like n=1 Tax=Pseudolycoriella hygida TaxID=35572 RepID=A0A9Q0MZ08_9DIPT|nr:Protein LEG1 like [Pseudolycoriella hygida]
MTKAISAALLNCTQVPAIFGADNKGNIFCGFDIQTNWQIDSGRQGAQTSARINEFSWFSDLNYQVTVVPYIATIKSNLLPAAKLLPPQKNSQDKFPVVYEQIDQEIAQGWTNVFEMIKSLQKNSTFTTLDNVQRMLWVVHNSTICKAIPKFKKELQLLNSKERRFANGFSRSVEALVFFNLNTGYSNIYSLNQMLPQRELRIWDVPPFIFDMTFQQNLFVALYFTINKMIKLNLWTGLLGILKNAMANSDCANALQQAFQTFISSPKGNIDDSLEMVQRWLAMRLPSLLPELLKDKL